MDSEIKKIGFFSAFWESCTNLSFYSKAALSASWLHVALHTLVLIILVSSAYSFASYNLLADKLNDLLKELPTIEVKDNKATWKPEDLKLPYIKKFPQNAPRKIYYILDSGKNKAALEEKYATYALFSQNNITLSDGYDRREFQYKELTKNSLAVHFFGDPLRFSPMSLAHFIAFCTIFSFGLGLALFLLILFPIANLFAALISSIASKWNLSFINIVKLSFFAATPACLIQIIGCLFLILNWQVFLAGLLISSSIQIAYLITGLKATSAS